MRNFSEPRIFMETECGHECNGGINKTKIIKSELTLFNPGKKEAALGNHGGGIDKDKGKMYGEIEIYIKDGKHYAKNKYGTNVFLVKGLTLGTQNFYFSKVDGKYVLIAEQDGVNYYFLENGEEYSPENKFGDKINETRKAMKKLVNELITKLLENISFLPNRNRNINMTDIYGKEK